jgi:hypothetical protein
MGASRSINVTGANKNTVGATAGGVFTHFRIYATGGSTPKTNWTALTSPQTIGAGGMLNVADAGIKIRLGVTGSDVVGQLSDAVLISMLDLVTGGFAATDVIKFATSSSGAGSTDIGTDFIVDGWDAAIAF